MFSGKVAVITGASSGIGAATAKHFAKEGSSLVLHGRNVEGLNDTKKACVAAGLEENKIAVAVCDLLEEKSVDVLVKTTLDTFGKINILFHNAGGGLSGSGAIHTIGTVEGVDLAYQLYVRTPYLISQKFCPELIKNKGVVIFNSSVATKMQDPSYLPYCVMKEAQDQMSKVMAMSLAMKGVRVNSIRPGPVRTNIITRTFGETMNDEIFEKMALATPLEQKLATVEDMARLVAFLASDQSQSITGMLIDCDKGFSMTHGTIDFTQF